MMAWEAGDTTKANSLCAFRPSNLHNASTDYSTYRCVVHLGVDQKEIEILAYRRP